MTVIRRPNTPPKQSCRPLYCLLASILGTVLIIANSADSLESSARELLIDLSSLRGRSDPVCTHEALYPLIQSPHFVDTARDKATFAETLALAKAEHSLKHPTGHDYPNVIQRCDDLLSGKHMNTKFQDVVLKQSYLDHLLPLDMPENVMHVLLGKEKKATVVDIGANVGQFGLPLARAGHTVYSFEPVDATCSTLKSNVAKEGLNNLVHVNCVGLDGKEAVKSFGYTSKFDPGSPSHHLVDPSNKNARVVSTVKTGPIHKFIEPQALDQVHLFKTDTQGNEEAVLRGTHDLLHSKNRPRFLLVEFSHVLLNGAGTEPRTILDLIYKAGYVCTHLTYHHPVHKTKSGAYGYKTVGTPPLPGDSVSATFDQLVYSIGPHSAWTNKDGTRLSSDVQGVPGWTDILCFA